MKLAVLLSVLSVVILGQEANKKNPDADKPAAVKPEAHTAAPLEAGKPVLPAHRLLMTSLVDAANRYLQSVQEAQNTLSQTACSSVGMKPDCFIDWNSGMAFKEVPKPKVVPKEPK